MFGVPGGDLVRVEVHHRAIRLLEVLAVYRLEDEADEQHPILQLARNGVGVRDGPPSEDGHQKEDARPEHHAISEIAKRQRMDHLRLVVHLFPDVVSDVRITHLPGDQVQDEQDGAGVRREPVTEEVVAESGVVDDVALPGHEVIGTVNQHEEDAQDAKPDIRPADHVPVVLDGQVDERNDHGRLQAFVRVVEKKQSDGRVVCQEIHPVHDLGHELIMGVGVLVGIVGGFRDCGGLLHVRADGAVLGWGHDRIASGPGCCVVRRYCISVDMRNGNGRTMLYLSNLTGSVCAF
mmetsp:Transcript_19186/g.44548  ORF Transcript_19186/g.44548 Transcript_19186/m.44548 type:complete len:292 (+) Transcript_19186:282-1157(+)